MTTDEKFMLFAGILMILGNTSHGFSKFLWWCGGIILGTIGLLVLIFKK